LVDIDGTAITIEGGCQLLTMSPQDSNQKKFIVLKVFVPNEKGRACKWKFHDAFALLLGLGSLNYVEVMLTGGDPQKIGQLKDVTSFSQTSKAILPSSGSTEKVKVVLRSSKSVSLVLLPSKIYLFSGDSLRHCP
jgi:hypothetical protein